MTKWPVSKKIKGPTRVLPLPLKIGLRILESSWTTISMRIVYPQYQSEAGTELEESVHTKELARV